MKATSRPRHVAPVLEAQAVKEGVTADRSLPPKPDGMGWRDYLIMLLHVGAELEHGLMVQYLYAAYSLDDRAGSAARRLAVGRSRNLLLTVAKEEMGHLLTVQNLLCLVGGPVCFKRSNFPFDTPFLPFPFRLEPVSTKSLAWYVYAEAPSDWQALLRRHSRRSGVHVEEDMRFVAETVGDEVLAGHAHTVGQLYDRIIEVISDPSRIPEDAIRPDTYANQATWDDWGRGYAPPPARPGETEPPELVVADRSELIIEPLATRTQAIAALRRIGRQGEAAHLRLPQDQEPSHFDRFLGLLDAFRKDHGQEAAVHKVPVNPTTLGTDDKPAGSTSIEQQTSLLWATLFNLRYRALLTYLAHTFRLARLVDTREPNVRGAVMHKIFGEMYNLKTIAGILVRRPLRDGVPAEEACAAPPFEMPYTIDLPMDEPDCWQRHRDTLTSSLDICHSLLMAKDPHAPALTTEEASYIKILRQLDQRSVAWIDVVKDGLLRKGGRWT
jgi:hypothetical protein